MDLFTAVEVLFDFESFLSAQDRARDAGAGQTSALSGPPPPVLREAVDTFCGAVLSAADNDAACGAIREAVCARAERLLPRLLGPDGGRAGNVGGSEGPSWESELTFANRLMILSIALSGALSNTGCSSGAGAGIESEAQGLELLAVQESCAAALSRLLRILLDVGPLSTASPGSSGLRPLAATAFAHEMFLRFIRTVLLNPVPRTAGIQGLSVAPPLSLRVQVMGRIFPALATNRPDCKQWFPSSENLAQSDLGLPGEVARCLIAVTKAGTDSAASSDAAEAVGGRVSVEGTSPLLDNEAGSPEIDHRPEDETCLRQSIAALALLGAIDLRSASKAAFESFCSFLADCPSYNLLDLLSLLESDFELDSEGRNPGETLALALAFAYQLFASVPSLLVRLGPLQQARLLSSLLERLGIAKDLEGLQGTSAVAMAMYSQALMTVLEFGCLGPMWLLSARPQLIDSLVVYAVKLVGAEKETPSDAHSDLVSSLLNFFCADPKARHYVLRNLLRSGLLPELRRFLEVAPRWALVTNKIMRSIYVAAVGLCGITKDLPQNQTLQTSLVCMQNDVACSLQWFEEGRWPLQVGDSSPDSLYMCCKLGSGFLGAAEESKLWERNLILYSCPRPFSIITPLIDLFSRATGVLADGVTKPSAPLPACPLAVVLRWTQILLGVHRIICEAMESLLQEARKSTQVPAEKSGKAKKGGASKKGVDADQGLKKEDFVKLSQCRREVSSLLRRMCREVLPEAERREAGRWEGVEEGEVAAALCLT